MKRIKIYVEGGVVQDVIFEGLIKDEEMTYEVIDYDEIDARENEKQARKIALYTCASDYLSSDWSNSAGDFTIEDIEEVQE